MSHQSVANAVQIQTSHDKRQQQRETTRSYVETAIVANRRVKATNSCRDHGGVRVLQDFPAMGLTY